MLKSVLAKLGLLAAAGTMAGGLIAAPAGAITFNRDPSQPVFVPLCRPNRPILTIPGSSSQILYGSAQQVVGTCFVPGSEVTLFFFWYYHLDIVTVQASAMGTISAPMYWDPGNPPGDVGEIQAHYAPNGNWVTNTLVIRCDGGATCTLTSAPWPP